MSNEMISVPRHKLEAMAFGRMEFDEFSQYMDELQGMLARPESASGKLPPIGRQAVWQAVDEALTGTVEPMLRGDICNILAALLVPATQHQGEPVAWWNSCNESVPAALRYLANHPRPSGGEQRYNAEHLYQLAGEIERMAKTPLYTRPAEQPAPVAVVHPFTEKVIRKLERFQECADDGQGADIGRHWFDLLTQLGLLNRVQRSPALWEMTQQGEDALEVSRKSAKSR
ncbi:hypothetical protein ACKWMZ_26655 [Pseudomonas protegens]|uniref:hypothetical protein n=1 Tax=Pseudomonas protegens TaxID=380021 RepID=UPI0039673DF5